MSRDSQINSFTEGMNKDISKSNQSDKSYLDAKNIRVVTDDGSSNGAMVNIKGNDYSFSFPGTSSVICFRYGESSLNASYTIGISVSGFPTQVATWNVNASTKEGVYASLKQFIDNNFLGLDLVAQYNANKVALYSTNPSTIIISGSITLDPNFIIDTSVVPQSEFIVIGSAYIRDYSLIFTANTKENEPVAGSGQIWKLEIDTIDYTPILELVRNAPMNFSASHLIEAVGRYETDGIQKVYWTDYHNKIRALNVLSDTSFLDPIDFSPEIVYSLPILQSINQSGGIINSGLYQASYRLSKSGGSSTQYSNLSNIVRIVQDGENAEYQEYQGTTSNGATSKSITWEIPVIDTSFDTIEIVIAYKKTANSSPEMSTVIVDNIQGSETYQFTYTGTEGGITDLSVAEFLIPGAVFTTAKTLDVKDNRLLVGNVREDIFDLEFDARAYRWAQLNDDTPGIGTMSWVDNVDDINPYNKDSTRYSLTPLSADQNKYQRNSGVLGGTGANINFRFTTQQFVLDGADINQPPRIGDQIIDNNKSYPTQTINGIDYPMGNLWRNYKNPYVDSLFRGYMRGETYRFGIVFYSKSGIASPVKWIADIRMPEHYDIPMVYTNVNNNLLGDALGIEFDVNLPTSVKDVISGYSIVRVERTDNDKTMVGQGIMSDILDNDGGWINLNKIGDLLDFVGGPGQVTIYDNRKTIDIPDFKFCGVPADLDSYSIRPVMGILPYFIDSDPSGANNTGVDHAKYGKFYNLPLLATDTVSNTIGGNTVPIDDFTSVVRGEVNNDILGSGETYRNYSSPVISGGTVEDSEYRGRGASTIYMTASAGLMQDLYKYVVMPGPTYFVDLGAEPGGTASTITAEGINARKLIFNLYRELIKQYGGDDFSSRANNIYVSTGHLQVVNSEDIILNYTSEVWGGDTIISAYDEIKSEANRDGAYEFGPGANNARLEAQIFPVETSVNTELRQGEHFASNGTGLNSDSTNPINFRTSDDYSYNKLYNSENDIKTSFATPLNFNLVSQFDNRVFASDVKINGESSDSWTTFRTNNFLDVDGIYGPINRLVNLDDRIYFFQDRGFGFISINPRSIVQGNDGVSVELGSGGILHDHDYVSTTIGCRHQWGICVGRHAIYFFDAHTKKFYRFGNDGTSALSDVKGMFSYFDDNVLGKALLSLEEGGDNPVLGAGIACTYDFKFNEALFTFRGVENILEVQPNTLYNLGDIVINEDGDYYENILSFTSPGAITDPKFDLTHWALIVDKLGVKNEFNAFTLAFNEFTNSFTSFYDFLPYAYINNHRYLLSPHPGIDEDIYT